MWGVSLRCLKIVVLQGIAKKVSLMERCLPLLKVQG